MYGVSFWILVIAHSFEVGVGKNAAFTCPGLLYSSQGYCGFSHPYLQNSPFGGKKKTLLKLSHFESIICFLLGF